MSQAGMIKEDPGENRAAQELIREGESRGGERRGDVISEDLLLRQKVARNQEDIIIAAVDGEREQ